MQDSFAPVRLSGLLRCIDIRTETQIGDLAYQDLPVDRLDEIGVAMALEGLHNISGITEGRRHDGAGPSGRRDPMLRLDFANPFQDILAVNLRDHNIEDE